MFKSWEELTVLEQMACTFSDMYKDAYGCRPRMDTSRWTVERFEQEFDRLQAEIVREFQREKQAQQAAIQQFEQRVTDLLHLGAWNRETAIRWIAEAEGTGDDREYLCYRLGLPFQYFEVDK